MSRPEGFTAAELAESDAMLDAYLKSADDAYAPRAPGYCWVSDPYAAQLSEDEDYSGISRAIELEGAS